MTDGRRGEEGFYDGADGPEAEPPPPRRRAMAALLARNPVFAAIAVLLCGWLLADLWPDVSYFLSPLEPIDLGGSGAYHLDLARENRLAQVRGELAQAVAVTEARTGAPRTVGRLAGTKLVVDRPGRGGPPVFEGRLLPAKANAEYAEAVAIMRQKGAQLGDRWLVLRDGERPRQRWIPVAGSAILLALALVNLRALLQALAR